MRARSPAEVWHRGEESYGQQGYSAGDGEDLARPVTAPLLAEWRLKEQVAEGRNGGDSAVLRALELGRSDLSAASFSPRSQNLTAYAKDPTQTLRS